MSDEYNGNKASELMGAYCFHVLEGAMKGWRPQFPSDLCRDLEGKEVYGMFVTYEARGALKGCVGTFEKGGLRETMDHCALAAIKDARIPPATVAELPDLKATVTVLSQMRETDRWDNWDIGTHGVYILFDDGVNKYSAAFLPNVITSQKWSKEKTMECLLDKAGYRGPRSPSVYERCLVLTFTGCDAIVDYSTYRNKYKDVWGVSPQ